jgi:hypothetical protein
MALPIANIRMWPDSTVSSVRRASHSGICHQVRGGTTAKKTAR